MTPDPIRIQTRTQIHSTASKKRCTNQKITQEYKKIFGADTIGKMCYFSVFFTVENGNLSDFNKKSIPELRVIYGIEIRANDSDLLENRKEPGPGLHG